MTAALALLFAVLLGVPLSGGAAYAAQSASASQESKTDRWLHVRVDCTDGKGEKVRINVPVEMAEKVLGAVNHDRLQGGRIRIHAAEVHGVDLRAILDAVRTSKDGEFVTVQSREDNVRVAKRSGFLLINVDKKEAGRDHVEIRVPMKVVDALVSAGKDELDIVAALRVLSREGDTELVSVKDDRNTVHVWLDAKSGSTD
ncbi:MAG TPA: hypothetical protein VEH49_09650 [Methylomirabilota bacterium]|nr:hypothetical protein [Methylomirabilota bacterium]